MADRNFEDERGAQKCMHFIERGYYFKGQPHNRRRPAIVSVAHLQGLAQPFIAFYEAI